MLLLWFLWQRPFHPGPDTEGIRSTQRDRNEHQPQRGESGGQVQTCPWAEKNLLIATGYHIWKTGMWILTLPALTGSWCWFHAERFSGKSRNCSVEMKSKTIFPAQFDFVKAFLFCFVFYFSSSGRKKGLKTLEPNFLQLRFLFGFSVDYRKRRLICIVLILFALWPCISCLRRPGEILGLSGGA